MYEVDYISIRKLGVTINRDEGQYNLSHVSMICDKRTTNAFAAVAIKQHFLKGQLQIVH